MTSRFPIFLVVFASTTLYTAFKAAALLPGHELAAWVLTYLFFFFIVGWQFSYRSGAKSQETLFFSVVAWSATFGMGVWATFLLFSLSADVAGLVMPVPRWLPWSVPAAAWAVAFLGLRVVLTGPKVKEVVVPIEGLAKGLEGLRIVQLSDLHVGPTIRGDYVERVVETAMNLKPDLLAVTGDLADGTPESLEPHMKALAKLKAPMGVYYVTGNHEYYWGAERWVERTKEFGFIPLINENRLVDFHGAKVLVGGVTDTSGGHFLPSHKSDPRLAAASAEKRDLNLLLAHRPDSCFEAEPAGFDVQLSGHTHGGQFFPWSLLIPLFHRYHRGLNRHRKLWVYVNSGTGYWGPPHRFAVPAEITLITLARNEV